MAQRETKTDPKEPPIVPEIREAAARLDSLLPRGDATKLAELSGVDESQISRIRNGKQLRFSANVAVRLSKALGIRVGWLLTGELPKDPIRAVAEGELDDASVEKIADAVAARIRRKPPVPSEYERPGPTERRR